MGVNKNIFKGIGIFLVTAMFFFSFVCASEIIVSRGVPFQVGLNQSFNVSLFIFNQFNFTKHVILTEFLTETEPLDNLDKIVYPLYSMDYSTNDSEQILIASNVPYYLWELDLDPNSITKVVYLVNPIFLGDINLGVARVSDNENEYFSDGSVVKVLCNRDGFCEPSLGENYFVCSEDCSSGGADGFCDMVNDGIFDPDCEIGEDFNYITNNSNNLIPGVDMSGAADGWVCESCFSSLDEIILDWIADLFGMDDTMNRIKQLPEFSGLS
ncbi:MAG: hypothetical protein WCP89_02185 [archaeon]